MITYNIDQYGLRQKDLDYMLGLFRSIPAIEKVIIYGSRAMGNFEKGSDIDLAIVGDKVTERDIAHLHNVLENDSPTLLWFDILHYNTMKNDELKQQIDIYGKVIFSNGN
jgi:predicted nucleotidyltransferase